MFMWHNITPSDFFARGEGEQKILHAFTAHEIEYKLKREQERDKAWAEFLMKIHGVK